MSHYSDMYRDRDRAWLIKEFGPKEIPDRDVTKENFIYALARARKAESELEELKTHIREAARIAFGGTVRTL